MYSYMICNQADAVIFKKQAKILKERIPGLIESGELLHDVDGTLVQRFYTADIQGGGYLTLLSDVPVGYVIIESTFDIDPFFPPIDD